MSTDAPGGRAGDTTGPDRPGLPAPSVAETVQAARPVEDRAAARATDLLWPQSTDLTAIEAVPPADRGLPTSTYELVERAAARWPDCDAAVLPVPPP
ncbi:MAG TPA: hypothetical protein VIU15_30000 [Streptomyces sp.]